MFNAPFDTLSNVNKPLYIAKKKEVTLDDYGNEIVIYDTPTFFGMVNYQPLTGNDLDAYIKTYGETNRSIIRLLIDYIYDGTIKQFDVAYLYGAKPTGELVNGENANYTVKTVKMQNTKIMVLFEEIIKEDNNGNSQD